jgi:integrase
VSTVPGRHKRGQGDGSYDRLPNGTWRGRVTLDGARRAVYGPTRANVVAQADALRRRHREGRLPACVPAHTTLAGALERLLEAKVAGGLTGRHLDTHRRNTATHLAPLHAVRVEQLAAADVRGLLAALLATRAPATVRHVRSTLRQAMALAVVDGLAVRNVVDDVPAPRLPRRPPRALQDAELARFWRAARKHRLYALWLLAARTGLRQGEQRALRWTDIDKRAGTLTVQHTMPWPGTPDGEKAAKSLAGDRTFGLTPGILAALAAHHDRQDEERAHAGTRWRESGLVFTTVWGRVLRNNAIWRAFQEVKCAAALADRVRPHDLRHTAASHLLAAGVSPAEVAQILGHASVAVTTSIYAGWIRRGGSAALQAVEDRDQGWSTSDQPE